jgi:hypothetical protein
MSLALLLAAYIDAVYPLGQFVAESEVVAELRLEKADPATRTAIARVVRSIKGKAPFEQVRLSLGTGQDWHPDAVMPHLVPGAPLLLFANPERRAEIYLNRFFLQVYGDPAAAPEKAWWTFTHIEIRCNRTFNGTVEELAKVVDDVVAGRRKAPEPDAKLPAITKEAVRDLPAWGKPPAPGPLPACFRRREGGRAEPRAPDAPAGAVRGVAFDVYEGAWTELPDFNALKPVATGIADAIDLALAKREDRFAMRFRGFLEVPKDGTYTFFTTSDDGSKFHLGSDEIVSNDGLHGAEEAKGEAALKTGRHAFTLTFFEAGGGEALELWYEGPGLPKQKVPPSALWRAPSKE